MQDRPVDRLNSLLGGRLAADNVHRGEVAVTGAGALVRAAGAAGAGRAGGRGRAGGEPRVQRAAADRRISHRER